MHYFMFIQFLLSFILAQIACTEHQEYPFLVKIEAKGKILVCAGTILTPCAVLTSAHCVEGVEPSKVIVTHATTSSVKTYHVIDTIIHPKYDSTVLANDIALLQVEKPFGPAWMAVTLSHKAEKSYLKCNSIEIVGWTGQIMKDPIKNDSSFNANSTLLEKPMKATVKLISNENCTALIQNFGGTLQGEEKLCGVTNEEGEEEEEEERCFTGPGGPVLCSFYPDGVKDKKRNSVSEKRYYNEKKSTLAEPIDLLKNLRKSQETKFKREVNYENYIKNLQIGVVSWGKSCSKVPSVYVKTDFYNDWIKEGARKITYKCFYDSNSFSFLTPLDNEGIKCSACFNIVIFFMLITILLRFF